MDTQFNTAVYFDEEMLVWQKKTKKKQLSVSQQTKGQKKWEDLAFIFWYKYNNTNSVSYLEQNTIK